ncbi:MAG: type III secretion system chaperone [Verrucomicrobia bacterium]|nr:type III secretion system chaperone [Verrucomicrobiota bacterium]
MLPKTATLLDNFSSKIGLTLPAEMLQEESLTLELSDDLAVQFEEDLGGALLWMNIPLLTLATAEMEEKVVEFLKKIFPYRHESDARLLLEPEGSQLLLASRFLLSATEEELVQVHSLEEQVRQLIRLAQTLLKPPPI